ncbi:MAG: cysteine desulfurase family protein [Planctomycetota bacterium]
MIYLDHNATTQPRPEVAEAMREAIEDLWHNPSSVHRAGQAARARVELARQAVADLIGAKAREIVFTGSGTESIDLAIRGGLAALGPGGVLVTDRAEHTAVRDLADELESAGVGVRWAPIGADGVVDPEGVRAALADRSDRPTLVSVQWANNETGAVQPIDAIGAACREGHAVFHCDATQWVGKMPTDVRAAPFDLMTLSAHKFHGPKGVGALWKRRGVRIRPTLRGSQELGQRGGTENVPGVLGLGAAAMEATRWLDDHGERDRLGALRDRLERSVIERCAERGVEVRPNTAPDRLWNTTNLGFRSLEAEALLMLLSEMGLAASAGAACSSGSLDPSPVLLAMRVEPAFAHGSVRFSLGRDTTEAEIERAIETIPRAAERLAGSSARLGVTEPF